MSSKTTREKMIDVVEAQARSLSRADLQRFVMDIAFQLSLRMTDAEVAKMTAFLEKQSEVTA